MPSISDLKKKREAKRKRRERLRELRKKIGRTIETLSKAIENLGERIEDKRTPNWNGCPPVLGATGARAVSKANEIGLVVTSTTGGQHAAGSYHYQRRAIDFGVNWSTGVTAAQRTARLVTLQGWLAKEYPNAREIFGPASFYIKNGSRVNSPFPNHGDHVHFAI